MPDMKDIVTDDMVKNALKSDAVIDDGNGERDLNDFYADIQTDA